MASPFPGMDPYLEAPDIWPDLHDALAAEIRALLNGTLPRPYYARLQTRPEVGIVEEEGHARRIIPDVAVLRRPGPASAPRGVALLVAPRTTISESVEVTIANEPIRHTFVEIRDPARGHQLITLIEIASPSSKRGGPDRRSYFLKQREVLDSNASLIELDLLRAGTRPLADAQLEAAVLGLRPEPHYLVLVNRAWKREVGAYQLFPVLLTGPLPCIPVPLREGQEEVPLDLQYAFNEAYDTGPYRVAVDYDVPPDPPLPNDLTAWAEQRLRDAGLRPPA